MFRNQHIVHWRAGKDCCDFDTEACFTWQVLRTMNCNIHLSVNEGSLDFCCEKSFSSRARIDNSGFVSSCRDNLRLDCDARMCTSNRFFDQPRLRARKFAAACSQDNLSASGAHKAPLQF
jgi:hypothetical protein